MRTRYVHCLTLAGLLGCTQPIPIQTKFSEPERDGSVMGQPNPAGTGKSKQESGRKSKPQTESGATTADNDSADDAGLDRESGGARPADMPTSDGVAAPAAGTGSGADAGQGGSGGSTDAQAGAAGGLVAPPPMSAQAVDSDKAVIGTWFGPIKDSLARAFTGCVKVTQVGKSGPSGTTMYVGALNCRAALNWTATNGARYTFNEAITSGTGCTQGSLDITYNADNTVKYEWYVRTGGAPESVGTLNSVASCP